MRIGLCADTHGSLDERVAGALQGCDLIIHAGDIGGSAILTPLARLGEEVVAVRGNNDVMAKWPRGERNLLAAIPDELSIVLPGGELVVVHGHRTNPAAERHRRLRRRYGSARAVVLGHSHLLQCDNSGEPWLLNPGAAGRARTHGGPSCIILQATDSTWTIEMRRFSPQGDEVTWHQY